VNFRLEDARGISSPRGGADHAAEIDAGFVADWQFAKKFDAYAGLMFSQVNGGLANGFLHRNSIDPTVGGRFRF
jgi:hypothetical protein